MKGIVRLLSAAVLGFALVGAATPQASAHGWHRDHWGHSAFFLGFNFGPPVYYYPPPVYYPPPPSVVYVVPQAQTPTCRRFNGNATIDASGRPFYGVACFESDGRWHIAN